MPSRSLKIILMFTCLALVAVIAHSAVLAPAKLSAPTQRSLAAEPEQPALAQDALAGGQDLLVEVLARPVFSADRRGRPAVAAIEIRPAAVAVQGPPPRLAGVMMTPEGAEALFARDGRDFVPVRAGERVEGWTVTRIEDMRVVLSGADGEIVLEPTGIASGGRQAAQSGIARGDLRPTAAWAAANPVAATAMALAASHSGRGDPYEPGPLQRRDPVTP